MKTPTATPPKRNFRRQPQPVCPVHGIPMLVRRTTPDVRYCYCPEERCRESYTQARRFA